MDVSITERDFLLASSNYSGVITIAKGNIKRFEDTMRMRAKEIAEMLCEKTFKSFNDMDEHIELWLKDLKAYVYDFEFYGRASTLRAFFHLSSYLQTLRSPQVRTGEPRLKIAICNVEFPKNHLDRQIPISLKPKRRARKKNLSEINVCR